MPHMEETGLLPNEDWECVLLPESKLVKHFQRMKSTASVVTQSHTQVYTLPSLAQVGKHMARWYHLVDWMVGCSLHETIHS